ncbi:MAG TPA: alkaline phosphatase D family protein [Solirubrobacteraceae bacterium]|nr:alkaline phosphatase D family protein [Solirubrobacteraceae bacterium]
MGITGDWDRRISRRTLLKTGGSFAAGLTLAGIAGGPAFGQAIFRDDPFTLGVASGDPSPTGVVLWTRLAPNPLAAGGGMPPEPFEVAYELSQDEDFHAIVRKGTTVALPDEVHSARAEIQGLGPEHEYYYRFKAGDWISPVGRTRTRPNGNSMVPSLTFAFVSCQNFAEGYFTPYDEIAASEDIETVIFLGDYIYEGRNTAVRTHEPQKTIQSLDEYRIRHGQYKPDPALQRAHAAHPWLITWDDHEFVNNYADDDTDQTPPVPAELVLVRRAAAYRAFWEHMPLARARKPVGPDLQLYRRFRWGQMATFNVLDGRQYRSDQNTACSSRDPSGYCVEHVDPSRTMLGAEQRDWLFEDMASTKARWNVLAQQTAFAPLNGAFTNPPRFSGVGADNWEGYVAERQRIIDWAVEHQTPNFVVLTGDSHRNWVRNIPRHYSSLENPMGVEFLGTSVSTGGDTVPRELFFSRDGNPQLLLQNNNRGYCKCTLTEDTWTSEYRYVSTVRQPQATVSSLATFVVQNGVPGAQRVAPV